MDLPRFLDGRLKLRHLVLVDALTEQGSVVGAAAQLRVTQPSLTRALHDLEDALGVPLYDRGPRGVTPTIFGTAFTAHARAVLAQLSQAGRHIADLQSADRGTVTVGIHLVGSNLLLPRAIARMKAERPNVVVIIREAAPEALFTDLEAGKLDFIVGRLTSSSLASTIQKTLYHEPIKLVTRTGHPAARLRAPKLAELAAYPWIVPGTATALRGELEQFFLRHNVTLPENRIECTSILTVRNLLLETDVIAALPLLIAADDPRIKILPLPLDSISHNVGVTRPAHYPPSPSAQALLDHLHAVAASLRGTAPALSEPD